MVARLDELLRAAGDGEDAALPRDDRGSAPHNAALCSASGESAASGAGGASDGLAALEASLTPAQRQAVSLLMLGYSAASVARIVGVDRGTIFRWRAKGPFAAALRGRQAQVVDAAADRLRALLVRAVDEVEDGLTKRDYDTRLRTALRLMPYVASRRLRPMPEDPGEHDAGPGEAAREGEVL